MILTQHPYHGDADAGRIVLTRDGKNLGEWHYADEAERRAQMRRAQDLRKALAEMVQ